MSVALRIAVVADVGVEVGSIVGALVQDGGLLVTSIKHHSWGSDKFSSSDVLLHFLVSDLVRNIDVTKLDAANLDGLNSREFLPLSGKLLAVTAGWIDVGNNPNVLGVGNDSLLKVLDFNAVVL